MQRFLCWDKKNILKNDGVMVYQHKPEKKNIALACSDAWEGVHNCYASIVQVGDTYRMYYRASGQKGFVHERKGVEGRTVICVAESKDGIRYTKPILGQFEYNGSKENNIVFWRDNGRLLDTFSVFYDQNPDCPEEERFKALARDRATDVLDCYVSADGYHFVFSHKIEVKGTFDSFNVAFWHKEEKQYRLYFRSFHHPDGKDVIDIRDVNATTDLRDVRLALSRDFKNWEFVDRIRFEEEKQEIQLYTNQISQYYREPKTFIGFPVRYCDRAKERQNFNYMPGAQRRGEVIEKHGRGGTALTDCVIMTSTDGLHFDRRSTAFITPGLEMGSNWWYGNGYTAYGLVETQTEDGENREISLYCGENYRVENVDFRRYTVRLDGFFSWFGDGDGGEVTTKPFVLEKEKMFVNFSTSSLGGLRISVLDKNGNEIEGYHSDTLFGDSTNRPVEFEKSLKNFVGKEISLRFKLEDCHLYSYTFE